MLPGEHVLIVSHTFPPYKGIGGRRWAKFAKALARKGYGVHVIHSRGTRDMEGSPWRRDIEHPGITVHPLPQRYPTVLFKRPLTTLREKILYRLWSYLLPVLVRGNWFDKSIFWRRQLLREAARLIREQAIRNVVITGAPFRLMSHALELKGTFPQVRLVADFRDPWSWGHGYGHGALGAAREQHERTLEAAVMNGYDRVISPAPAIVDHLKEQYPAAAGRVFRVPHAIDPDEIGPPVDAANDGWFRMIYAGSLYGAREAEAYFDALLAAFQRTRTQEPAAFARCVLDLYITGHDIAPYEAKVKAAGLEGTIVFHPPLPAREIFPRIARANLVVVFIPTINRDFLGTKFTEIFYMRRPVLHVGAQGLVSRTITGNRLGASIGVDELEAELPGIISGKRTITIDPGYDLRPHLLDNITDRLLAEVLT